MNWNVGCIEVQIRLKTEPTTITATEYDLLLQRLTYKDEGELIEKYLVLLKKFWDDPVRKRQYSLARSMLASLTSEAREFVLRILDENIFGTTRLNSLCRLEYFSVEATVLLNALLVSPQDSNSLELAVRNFQNYEIMDLIEFLCFHTPEQIVARMKKDDVFRCNFSVSDPETCFSEEQLRDFIAFICKKIDIEIPSVAVPLFARVRLAGEFSQYFRGRTEVEDFYKICHAYAKNEQSVLRLCLVMVGRKSNPLGKFFCEMLKTPFLPNSDAHDYSPHCVVNDALHNLACNRHQSLTDNPSVKEFARHFRSAKYVTIIFHQNTINSKVGEKVCDFFSFRMDDRIFHYSVKLSAPYKKDVIRALVGNSNKPIFVYDKNRACRYLRECFGWTPTKATDAKSVAADNKILPRLEPMTNALVGGGYCERATNFYGGTMPSQTALRHLDVTASLIHEFCLRFKKDKAPAEKQRRIGNARDRDDRRH